MSKIIDFSPEKEKVQDNFVISSGKIKIESKNEYPVKIKIEKEGGEWKITDMELIPLPYDILL